MHATLVWILYLLWKPRMSPADLAFFLTLLSLSAQGSEREASCQASVAWIARESGFSPRMVQLARAELERLGWIRVERSAQGPNRYHILFLPSGWRMPPGTLHPALTWLRDQLRVGRWSRGTLLVYFYLLAVTVAIPPHMPHCQRSVEQIAKDTGLSPRGVRGAVGDLQGRGFVEVRARSTVEGIFGRQMPNLYFIQQFPPLCLVPTAPGGARQEELQEVAAWYDARRSDYHLSRSAATARQTEQARGR